MRFRKIGIVGAGMMGQILAETMARKGMDAILMDRTKAKMIWSIKQIEQHLDKQLEKWAITTAEKKMILSRIHTANDWNDLSDCDMVIETVTEDLENKQQVFQQLDKICKEEAILASNTSTLSLSEIASATNRADRTIGLHFLHPLGEIDLVEIVRGVRTSEKTFQEAKRFVSDVIELKGILVYESPGFVSTRLICVLINEALHTLSEHVASAEDIDTAMKIGYNFKYGPLEMCDRFGLDSVLTALEQLFHEYGELKYRPSYLLKKMVRAGKYGVKTGEGFFRYDRQGNRLKGDMT